MPPHDDDPRIHGLAALLDPIDWAPDQPTPGRARAQAAVSIVLRSGADLDVLLVKRAEHEHDPWSGHMALPGGRRDAGDRTLIETAARETAEETGILLAPHQALGRVAPVSPSSTRLPSLTVSPFVFVAPEHAEAVPEPNEIDRTFWVPLDLMLDPGNHAPVRIPLIGTVREFPSFRFEEEVVWGLTYRILESFLERVRAAVG